MGVGFQEQMAQLQLFKASKYVTTGVMIDGCYLYLSHPIRIFIMTTVFRLWTNIFTDFLWETSPVTIVKMMKSSHLVPASITTLACFKPFAARSLMTSRMIREPMKVYSDVE